MRLAALGFAAGAAWLQFQPVLPGGNGRLVLVVLMLLAAALAQPAGKRLGGQVRLVLIALAFVFAGALLATFIAQAGLDDRLAPEWEGRRITLVGVVSDLPQPGDRSLRFDFDVESAIPPEAHVPSRVRLSWFNGLDKTEFETLQPMRAGERWRLPVTLKRAHGGVNRDGFDYEAYLFERGIRATGTVNAAGAGEIERLDPKAGGIGHAIDRLRESVRERYWDSAGDRPLTGVLVALAIGEQRAIEPADWDVFARTGTAHLMSISGLHVTMVAGLFAWVVGFAWRRIPPLALSLPAQKAAATAGFVAAFGYCLLAGFAVPAQRTLYMLGVVAAARLFGRDTSASHTLAAAMLVVLLLDPMAVVSPGFWLSFGAVAAIFYAGPRSMLPRPWWSEWGRMQWAVTIALVPMSLVFFQQVSLVSPLANAIAIPVVSWIVTPLALLAAVLPAGPMLGAAHAVLEPLIVVLGVLSAFDSAQWTQHAPPLWSVALALAGLAWLLAPRGIPARSLGAVLCLPMIALPPAAPAHGELQLTMLDVGQGLAVLARTSHHTLLFDTGPSWGQDSDSGKRVVVPALRAQGISRLDAAVVSHDDSDHAGGARSVLGALPTGIAWTAIALPDDRVGDSRYRLPCLAGRRWSWDGVEFLFVHPDPATLDNPFVSTNNRSCVLRAVAPGGTVLFTADIERRAEQAIVLARASELRADVLLVPHHGAAGSSSPEFVQAVAPRYALVSAGYRNRFGHPRAEVVRRYETAGAQVLRTDRGGAIELRVGSQGIETHSERERAPRYWQDKR